MRKPSLNRAAARVLLGAATLLAGPTGAAHAAAVELLSVGHEVLLCRVEHRCAHDTRFAATPDWQWVVAFAPARFQLGEVLDDDDGDSPYFASLTLSCVRRDRIMVGELPLRDEPRYSIELDRDDPLWAIADPHAAPSAPSWHVELPRDGSVVSLRIGPTGMPRQPLRLVSASFRLDGDPAGVRTDYQLDGHDWRFIED